MASYFERSLQDTANVTTISGVPALGVVRIIKDSLPRAAIARGHDNLRVASDTLIAEESIPPEEEKVYFKEHDKYAPCYHPSESTISLFFSPSGCSSKVLNWRRMAKRNRYSGIRSTRSTGMRRQTSRIRLQPCEPTSRSVQARYTVLKAYNIYVANIRHVS